MSFAPLSLLALLATTPCTAVAQSRDFFRYQVPLGVPPTTSQQAVASLNSRLDRVVEWNACGREIDFFNNTSTNDIGEGLLGGVIGKIRWMQTHGDNQSCTETVRFRGDTVPGILQSGDDAAAQVFNDQFAMLYGASRDIDPACPSVISSPSKTPGANDHETVFEFTFTVSKPCMKRQINVALTRPVQPTNLGTTDLPCGLFKDPAGDLSSSLVAKTGEGEWDIRVRDLMRVLYLPGDDAGSILDRSTRDYVMANFITLGGPLEEDSYSIYECGNQEHDSGSPQDRADERSWTDDGLFGDLGDLLDWLWHRILIFAGVAAAILIGYFTLGFGLLIPVAITAGAIGVAVGFLRIPESENHLFMINTSRYLTNQLIIDALPDEDDRADFQDDQKDIKRWLLDRLQEVMKEDFREYNARPYQRYTIMALLNLHDFARDPDLRTATESVLDFAFAKFAVGSSEGRRAPPFRRLMEVIPQDFLTKPPDAPGHLPEPPRQLFDLVGGADHMIAEMLVFVGQTQQLPEHNVSIDAASEMIYAATTTYRPDPVILSVAVNKAATYEQRIHHEGLERYYSTPGFLLSAGGIQTGLANQPMIGPISFDTPKGLPFDKDRGVAMPTVLMANAGLQQTRVIDFLRIEGAREFYSKVDQKIPGQQAWSFDHNVCLRRGFACGANITVPPEIERCLSGFAGAPDQWRFIDSASCSVYGGGRRFYVVVYRQPCTAPGSECLFTANWGFFEAVDDPGIPFEDFVRNVINANPASLTASLSDPSKRTGTYVAANGDRIAFDDDAQGLGDDDTGIVSVNGDDAEQDAGDWDFAQGDIIRSKGDGRMEIRDPNSAHWIEIDFSDNDHPKRTVH